MSLLYFDPVTSDPPEDDAAYPSTYAGVTIPSAGQSLYGVAYVAQGPGPHQVAVFLHGLPGHERNLDIAQAARRAGWSTLAFSYRGTWGSGGEFTFTHVLDDVRAALDWLATDTAYQTLRTDGARIALIGISMGAWAALLTAVDRPGLMGVAALAPWNLGAYAAVARDPEARPAILAFIERLCAPLKTNGADLVLNEAVAQQDRWNYEQYAMLLRERQVLLIAGAEDDEAPPPLHFVPLVKALEGGPHIQHHTIAQADHAFSARRIELTRRVVDWLESLRRA